MRLLFFRNKNMELLRWFTMESFCKEVFIDALARRCFKNDAMAGSLVPQEWIHSGTAGKFKSELFPYASDQWQIPQSIRERQTEDVFLYSAETVFDTDEKKIQDLFETIAADVLTIQINPALSGSKEVIRLTPDNHVVGFRRLYETSDQRQSFLPSGDN